MHISIFSLFVIKSAPISGPNYSACGFRIWSHIELCAQHEPIITYSSHYVEVVRGRPLPYYVFYASPDITWHAPLVCWPMLASEILPIAGSYWPRTSSLDVIRTSHLKSQRRLILICYLHIVTISVALVRYFALGGGHSLLWPEAILFLSYWEVYSR